MSAAAPEPGLFAVWASDHADALPHRLRVRPAHRQRLRAPAPHAVQVLAAGPTFAGPGGGGAADPADPATAPMNGTLLIVRAPNLEAVRAFVDGDPYQREGVYARVEIRPWHCGLGPWNAEPGSPA